MAADLLDIARQEFGCLVNGRVLIGGDNNCRSAVARCQEDVAWLGRASLNPGAAENRGPGGRLCEGGRGPQQDGANPK